jgi:hypothetical protein
MGAALFMVAQPGGSHHLRLTCLLLFMILEMLIRLLNDTCQQVTWATTLLTTISQAEVSLISAFFSETINCTYIVLSVKRKYALNVLITSMVWEKSEACLLFGLGKHCIYSICIQVSWHCLCCGLL